MVRAVFTQIECSVADPKASGPVNLASLAPIPRLQASQPAIHYQTTLIMSVFLKSAFTFFFALSLRPLGVAAQAQASIGRSLPALLVVGTGRDARLLGYLSAYKLQLRDSYSASSMRNIAMEMV
ncbi:hypothetical protein CCUS01_12909 [Colletotrichum cuscutae]|uniref:Uncharacterized protein n=1 Tax=Colletotrichum cuscutae TaxID=1209917 RepID=A0AAI9YD10_9PEZI|nr:hypothetical protein CCUS01_12909 [Colletotrichum cuscutae]